MNKKHTPGPWLIQSLATNYHGYPDWQTFAVRSPQNVCLAVVGDVDHFESERIPANTRLMAAAPELLNALELAEATIERLHRHAPGSANGTLDVIRAAIEKASS